mmetsp:Transcript_32992/g.105281  ORF Transcript_32992/g.105281 Transcript_32992/m.105281 type:complete len:329 (-) Transcript_32992:197-1183(-)
MHGTPDLRRPRSRFHHRPRPSGQHTRSPQTLRRRRGHPQRRTRSRHLLFEHLRQLPRCGPVQPRRVDAGGGGRVPGSDEAVPGLPRSPGGGVGALLHERGLRAVELPEGLRGRADEDGVLRGGLRPVVQVRSTVDLSELQRVRLLPDDGHCGLQVLALRSLRANLNDRHRRRRHLRSGLQHHRLHHSARGRRRPRGERLLRRQALRFRQRHLRQRRRRPLALSLHRQLLGPLLPGRRQPPVHRIARSRHRRTPRHRPLPRHVRPRRLRALRHPGHRRRPVGPRQNRRRHPTLPLLATSSYYYVRSKENLLLVLTTLFPPSATTSGGAT